MKIQLPWGPGSLAVDVPDTWEMVFPGRKPGSSRKKTDEIALVRNSLAKPVGAQPLAKRKLKGKKIVIIVDDNTRPTPVERFFHVILDSLLKSGAVLKNVLVIPALGIHTPMKEHEMAAKLGPRNMKLVRWENHDAFSLEKNHYFGTTSRNTPVYLNRNLKDADLVAQAGVCRPPARAACRRAGSASETAAAVSRPAGSRPPAVHRR